MTLDFTLDPADTDPLFLQIAARVRSAVVMGQIAPGARLPSARALAVQLAVGRSTVEAAYALLATEGAVDARAGGGTIIAGTAGSRIEHTPFMFSASHRADVPAALPFRGGLPALDAFPRKLWTNLTIQATRATQPTDLAQTDPSGLPALRAAVAAYLGASRGIRCSAAQVIITGGYQGALSLVRGVLLKPGDAVWMEDPGYALARQALDTGGARVVPVRVDQDGLRVTSGIAAAPKARLAVVTPCHQYPTGVPLSLPRRLELLAWAEDAGSWILEDDYDSEFRYAGRPLPSLKSLDRGQRVLYAGSFSKVLFPALRLGYLVVPPELTAACLRAARLLSLGQPVLEQAVTAAFMQKGHFTKHVRRMRALYGDRLRAVAEALDTAFGNRIVLDAGTGGMHLMARFPGTSNDTGLVKRAAAAGLGPSALSALTVAHDQGQGLLLGFTNIAADDARQMAERLRDAIYPGDHPLAQSC
jgi:GntR family transcriptional regulator/MocR family aminotransferase